MNDTRRTNQHTPRPCGQNNKGSSKNPKDQKSAPTKPTDTETLNDVNISFAAEQQYYERQTRGFTEREKYARMYGIGNLQGQNEFPNHKSDDGWQSETFSPQIHFQRSPQGNKGPQED